MKSLCVTLCAFACGVFVFQPMLAQPATPTLDALAAAGQVKIDSIGTGETIGHVADLKIHNLTGQPIICTVGPMILESKSRKNQDYVCPKPHTAKIDPHGTTTVPMNGVCVNRNIPPVGKGAPGDLIVNTGDPSVPANPDSHIPTNQARDLLRICTSKYTAADQLQKSGALKNLPYHDPQKQKDIVVQWSTWCDPRISQITGAPPATKDDLKKVVYKQLESKKPMSPETRKKVDQGIDTIFEKVELTTAKAKDLEKPGPIFTGPESTGQPEAFFKPGSAAKPATVAQSGDVAHVEDKPRGAKGHWAVKVTLPSGEIVDVWFDTDEPPPLEFCNKIKINKTHTTSRGKDNFVHVDEYVKNPSPTPTPPPPTTALSPTPTAAPTATSTPTVPPVATSTATQPPQPPGAGEKTEPEKPQEEAVKPTEPEPPEIPDWLKRWRPVWEAAKAGTGIVPSDIPDGKAGLGLVIQRLNKKITDDMANGKDTEWYEHRRDELTKVYNGLKDDE
jgi:hypothetical protein